MQQPQPDYTDTITCDGLSLDIEVTHGLKTGAIHAALYDLADNSLIGGPSDILSADRIRFTLGAVPPKGYKLRVVVYRV